MKNWDKTRKSLINWLSNTQLKNEMSKSITFEDLSIWWLTKLNDKDNINDQKWYYELNKKINLKGFIYKKNFFFILFFVKFIKNLITKIFFAIFISVYFKKIKISKKNKYCLYSVLSNFRLHQNKYTDYQYGNFGLKVKKNNKKFYFIDLQENFNLLKNFKKIKFNLNRTSQEYVIDQHYLSLSEIFKIYFFSLKSFFKTLFLLRKKNYFFLNNKDCSVILKYKLLESFSGSIQDQLLRGLAIKNYFKNNKCKNFITYLEFLSRSRAIYFFARKAKFKNIISIQHGSSYENFLPLNLNIKDFSNKKKISFCSPRPDFIFCQGKKYYNKMIKIFSKKNVNMIGSLKIELNERIRRLKIKKNNSKRKILIISGISDYASIFEILNKSELSTYDIFLSTHPVTSSNCTKLYKENFNYNFTQVSSNFYKKLSENDVVIFGESSLGIELTIQNYNTIRVFDKKFIPCFDISQEIRTALNERMLHKFLKKNNISNKDKLKTNYFFKYDGRATEYLNRKLKKINR